MASILLYYVRDHDIKLMPSIIPVSACLVCVCVCLFACVFVYVCMSVCECACVCLCVNTYGCECVVIRYC